MVIMLINTHGYFNSWNSGSLANSTNCEVLDS